MGLPKKRGTVVGGDDRVASMLGAGGPLKMQHTLVSSRQRSTSALRTIPSQSFGDLDAANCP